MESTVNHSFLQHMSYNTHLSQSLKSESSFVREGVYVYWIQILVVVKTNKSRA